ncbi:MAG: hypothetical protein AB7O24_12315 [Kofleriaceae bacterium]
MKRIGEILLARGFVTQAQLDTALADQRPGQRLCSLLIQRGQLDKDHAAQALGEQHGVAAVTSRHLEGRDRQLANRLPAALGRTRAMLPIGKASDGSLIVCVRDPSDKIRAELWRALPDERIVLAVAAACVIEGLVGLVYATIDNDDPVSEFDVDLSTGVESAVPAVTGNVTGTGEPPAPNLSEFTLVELDDLRVAKDHTQSGQQSGQFQVSSLLARANLSPPPDPSGLAAGSVLARKQSPESPLQAAMATPRTTTSSKLNAQRMSTASPLPPKQPPAAPMATPVPRATPVPVAAPRLSPTLTETLVALECAVSPEAAADIAMKFVNARWGTWLACTIEAGTAIGLRGAGPEISPATLKALSVPLAARSIIRAAHDRPGAVAGVPPQAGPIQERIERLLGNPEVPSAVAIATGKRVTHVIVVGNPNGNATEAPTDLEDLAMGLGDALARIQRVASH